MQIEDFSLTLLEDTVPCRIFTPADSTNEYCVLWLQGWSSSMDSHRDGVTRMAEQTNTVFVTLDPAGHGLHPLPLEESTRKQQHEEIVAVFDELKKRGYQKIIVIGGSFGAYMASLLAAKRPAHAIVLRAPANYIDEEFELQYKDTLRSRDLEAYERHVNSDDRLLDTAATKAVRSYEGFVYVLAHELDEVVPSRIPESYFAAAKHGNYLLIPKTKHSPKLMRDPQNHFDYIEHVVVAIVKAIKLQDTLSEE